MPGKTIAIDPGAHSFKVLGLKDGKGGLELQSFASVPAATGAQGLAGLGLPLKGIVAGVAGRDMTLRYVQVPPSPDWQLRNLMELEITDLASQSGDELSADYNLLAPVEEDPDGETVLMALARNEALERVSQVVEEAGGSVAAHVPNCIAIYNAYLRTYPAEEDQVVCIANIGHETVDIALAKGQDLLFARNLSGGGKVLDEAIASAFDVSARKAEVLKKELLDLDPASRGKYASGQAEKVTVAAGGAATMLASAVQSSIAFCRSQTGISDLNLDKLLICGGSARLRGIRGYLRESLRCPVELFDPFAAVDTSKLDDAELEELDRNRSEAVVALGLAATVLDPSLYSLEILPEAVKRRQRFMQRTIFNIAAVILASGLLAWQFSNRSALQEEVRRDARRAQGRASAAQRTHKEVEELVARNELYKGVVAELQRRSVPLDGSLNVLRALQELMPPELWIESIEIARSNNRTQSPTVEVKGFGKNIKGRQVTAVFGEFAAALKARKELGRVEHPPTPTEEGIRFQLRFEPLVQPVSAKDPEQEKDN